MSLTGNPNEYNWMIGYIVIGGKPDIIASAPTADITADGAVVIGGNDTVATIPSSSSVYIGGDSKTCTLNGVATVAICASGTVGASETDTSLLLIGGAATTLYGIDSICIGTSTDDVTLFPTNPKLFIKDSTVVVKKTVDLSTPGAIGVTDLSGGMITFSTNGTYTLPTASALFEEVVDQSSTTFASSVAPSLLVTMRNTSGNVVTVSTSTGTTLTNGGTLTIAAGESKTLNMWFTSPTVLLIEDAKAGTFSYAEPLYTSGSKAIISGSSNTNTSVASGAVVGGLSATNSISASTGGVIIGGSGTTSSVASNGSVVVCADGTTGTNSADENLVLIGGAGTTLGGNSGSSSSVCIGPSVTTQTFSPSASQLFLKSNPVWSTVQSADYTATGTISTADFVGGFVQLNPAGIATLTTPTATALYNYAVDNSSATFGLNMSFNVFINNASASVCTLAAGTGVTLQGTTTILGSGSAFLYCVFLSSTTMIMKIV